MFFGNDIASARPRAIAPPRGRGKRGLSRDVTSSFGCGRFPMTAGRPDATRRNTLRRNGTPHAGRFAANVCLTGTAPGNAWFAPWAVSTARVPGCRVVLPELTFMARVTLWRCRIWLLVQLLTACPTPPEPVRRTVDTARRDGRRFASRFLPAPRRDASGSLRWSTPESRVSRSLPTGAPGVTVAACRTCAISSIGW